VVRKIFGPKMEEEEGGLRRMRNVELHNLYASLNVTKVIKSRRIILAGRVAGMEEINK
jgi:hypothetical protein